MEGGLQQEGRWSIDVKLFAELTDSFEGLDLNIVKPGDVVVWKTRNSLYSFLVQKSPERRTGAKDLKNCSGLIQGGYFKDGPTLVEIPGSTFGGSMIQVDTIKKGMMVEILIRLSEPDNIGRKYKTIITTPVENIKLIKAKLIQESQK